MARSARNADLETRSARFKKIKEGERIYVAIGKGFSLGYRRPKSGNGTWELRFREAERYSFQVFAEADDYQDADGVMVLGFFQAQDKARLIVNTMRMDTGVFAKPLTVDDAIHRYLDWFRDHRKSAKETESAIQAHITPHFGKKLVGDLKSREIREWLEKMATRPPRRRTPIGKKQAFGDKPRTDEEKRKRRATANRVFTILKAILNRAYQDELVPDDSAWRKVKPLEKSDGAVTRFLTDSEASRLVNVCPQDFRLLVKAALFLGARYGDLARVKTADINLGTEKVFVHNSKNGKPLYVPLSAEGLDFAKTVVLGKKSDDLVFTRTDGLPWGKNHQDKPLKNACAIAKIVPAIRFHDLRHTFASALIQRGVPMSEIAALIGDSERTCWKHYGHLCDDNLRSAMSKLPSFGHVKEQNNIVEIKITK